MKVSHKDLILSYFRANPNRDVGVGEVVDWAVVQWRKNTGGKLPTNTNALRALYEEGQLVRVKKGVYRYAGCVGCVGDAGNGGNNAGKTSRQDVGQKVLDMVKVSKDEVVNLHKTAKKQGNSAMMRFYGDLLAVYEKHGY